MSHNIFVCFNLKTQASPIECLYSAIEIFSGYFVPHTAFMLSVEDADPAITPQNVVEYGIGGYHNWKEQQVSRSRLLIGDTGRLEREQEDWKHLWTTADYADCRPALHSWYSQVQSADWWKLSLHGNLNVVAPDNARCSVFREISPFSNEAKPSYTPLLDIGCITGAIYKKMPIISFSSASDIWLEDTDSFRGSLRATAQQNTANLVKYLKRFTETIQGSIDEIYWYAMDPMTKIPDANHLWKTFQAIPGITIG